MLFQFILNGLTNGSLYALMAVGVTMVYKSLGMLNFSHGDIMMIGTFIALTIIKLKVPLFASLIIAVLAAAVIGFLLERLILRRVEFSSFINLLIATDGAMVVFGTNPQRFPSLFSQFPVNIAGFKVSPQSIGIILVSVTLIVALHLFFTRVKVGKCMELASSDAQSAAMMGINVSHMRFLRFGMYCRSFDSTPYIRKTRHERSYRSQGVCSCNPGRHRQLMGSITGRHNSGSCRSPRCRLYLFCLS